VVTVVFLGRLRDSAGMRQCKIELHPSDLSLAGLMAALDALVDGLGAALADPSIRVAINKTMRATTPETALNSGDEVAFMPPVTGG
jgi:molybdopterin synthase sulfur carrier subunit